MLKKYLKSAIYLLLLMYLYVSVFSYNYKDPSLNTTTDEEVTNLCGIVGSYLADILVQFLGLTSIAVATTIVYFLILRPSKRLLKILYLTLINLGICSILAQLSLSITARYMHGGIIGNALISNYPFYIFTVATSIGIVGLIGWKRTIYFIFFLCKKIASLFANVLFFGLRKTAEHSIVSSVVEEQHRAQVATRQQPKERQKKVTGEILKPSSGFEFPSIHLLSKAEKSLQRKQLNEMESNKNLSLLEQVLSDFGVQGKIINVC